MLRCAIWIKCSRTVSAGSVGSSGAYSLIRNQSSPCHATLPGVTFLGMSADAWTAIGTMGTLVVLAITLLFVRRQVAEATALRRNQSRPMVVVSIDVEQRSVSMLTVENVGVTPAYNVTVASTPGLQSTLKDFESIRMLNEPIPMLPPGRKFRATWEVGWNVFEADYPHPLTYDTVVTYSDNDGFEYGPEKYLLDFRVFEGQAVGLRGLHEIAEAVDRLVTEHKRWTKSGRGIRVFSIDEKVDDRRASRPLRLRDARREFRENGFIAAIRYWITLLQRRYGLWIR